MNFKFSTSNVAVLGNVRVSQNTHNRVKTIAANENVTIQEVARVFIEAALEEYDRNLDAKGPIPKYDSDLEKPTRSS